MLTPGLSPRKPGSAGVPAGWGRGMPIFFVEIFLDFSETVPYKKLGFSALNLVYQDASFELSKTYFGRFFIFFIIPSDLGWVKNYQHRKWLEKKE